MPGELERLAFDLSLRALSQQEHVVEELRSRPCIHTERTRDRSVASHVPDRRRIRRRIDYPLERRLCSLKLTRTSRIPIPRGSRWTCSSPRRRWRASRDLFSRVSSGGCSTKCERSGTDSLSASAPHLTVS